LSRDHIEQLLAIQTTLTIGMMKLGTMLAAVQRRQYAEYRDLVMRATKCGATRTTHIQ
jgi:hypothetical protein